MRLRHRLKRLELVVPPAPVVWLVCVDEEGRVLGDGSAEVRPWVGRHFREVPGTPKVLAGIDPLVVLGRDAGPRAEGTR
jgi:hypothetical protein